MTTIREHAFNTEWFGAPVGIVTDVGFFAQPPAVQEAQLRPFAWVECKYPLTGDVPWQGLRESGFFQADTQIDFRIGLQRVASSPSLAAFEVRFADQAPFALTQDDVAIFAHERFYAIPDLSTAQVQARYVTWGNELIERQPEWCAALYLDGVCQGWFLSEKTDKGLRLALAMGHREAKSSGLYLYQASMLAYAQRGARIGYASFSVRNIPVLNIYSQLKARFVGTTGQWLWLNGAGSTNGGEAA